MAKKTTTFEFKEPVTRPSMPIPAREPDTAVYAVPTGQPVREQASQPHVVQEPTTRVTAVPRTARPSTMTAVQQAIASIVAEFKAAKTAVTISFAAGVIVGLPILGWLVWPVQWTDAPLSILTPPHQAIVVELAADLAAYDSLSPRVAAAAYQWPGMADVACQLAGQESDPAQMARFISLAYRVNGSGCTEK